MECFIKRWLKTKESNYFEWNIRLVNKLINFTRKFIHLCNYSVRIADYLFEIWSNRYNNLFQIETFHSCKHSFLLCTQWYTVRFITSDEINVFLLSIYIYIYIYLLYSCYSQLFDKSWPCIIDHSSIDGQVMKSYV